MKEIIIGAIIGIAIAGLILTYTNAFEVLRPGVESVKNMWMQNIEMSSNLFDQYVKMRVDAIKSYDNYVHVMMNSYANFLSQNGRF